MLKYSLSTTLLVAALAPALGGSCSSSPGDPDAAKAVSCPIGDLSKQAEIEIVHRGADGEVVKSEPMMHVPLAPAIQGGRLVLPSVRARNVDGCQLRVAAAIEDMCDGSLITVRERSVQLEPDGEGWGIPVDPKNGNFPNFVNLNACPQSTAKRDVEDNPYMLHVIAKNVSGETLAEASMPIIPDCTLTPYGEEVIEQCKCECDEGYILGRQCPEPEAPEDPDFGQQECPSDMDPDAGPLLDGGLPDGGLPDGGLPDGGLPDGGV